VVLFAWFNAKPKAVQAVADYHASRGRDVLSIQTSAKGFVWHNMVMKIVNDLINFTDQEEMIARPIVTHSFSAGNYFFTETWRRSPSFRDRVVAQIVDSPVDFLEAPNAIARSIYPQNRVQQVIMKSVVAAGLYSSYPFTMRHYVQAANEFKENPVRSPSLWLYSKNDLFNKPENTEMTIGKWEKSGIVCMKRCWEESPHSFHFKKYTDEYERLVDQFLDPIFKPKNA